MRPEDEQAATLASPGSGGRRALDATPAELSSSSSSREPGALLAGRYRFEGLVGKGGMGEVHRAMDLLLGERVAVKLLTPELASDPGSVKRVRDEVSLARKVSHPNVCRVHDVGEASGQLFVTMELIDGEDLASLLRRIGRLPGEKALEVARQVTAGLSAAHAAGVLHRDLKPANIMFDAQGRARISDFGLAVTGPPAAGEVAGTPAYMAPEILAGGSASVPSDVYALGLVLYELVTGKRPVEATTLAQLRERRTLEVVPPSQLVADVDPHVERTILACLAVDPAMRPPSALAVLTELAEGDAVGAALAAGQTPSPSAVASSGPAGTLRPGVAWGLAAAFAGSIALGFGLFQVAPAAKLTVPDLDGVPNPPAVLALRARESLEALGIPLPAGREEGRYVYAPSAIRWGASGPAGGERFLSVFQGARPAPIRFVYRKGRPPERVASPRAASSGVEPAASMQPGEVAVTLDTRGRLLRVVAGPDPALAAGNRPREELLAAALKLAAIEAASISPAAPVLVPPVFAEERLGWKGALPGKDGLPLRVELATFRSRPVFFSVSFGPEDDPRALRGGRTFGMDSLAILTGLAILVAALVMAGRNLKSGKGDRAGALRVAVVVFALDFLVQLLRGEIPATAGAASRLLFWRAGASLLAAFIVAAYYLAIEPHARRLWPESLVSWARLLSGRTADPLVGRAVLLGLVFYQLLAVGMVALVAVTALSGAGAGAPIQPVLAPLSSTRFFLAALLDAPRNGIDIGLFYLLALVLVRLVAPKRMAGPVFFGVLFVLTLASLVLVSGSPRPVHFLVAAFLAGAWTLLVTRPDLLSMIVIVSVFDLAIGVPLTMDFGAWWSDRLLWVLAILAALAAWGARVASRGASGARDAPR